MVKYNGKKQVGRLRPHLTAMRVWLTYYLIQRKLLYQGMHGALARCNIFLLEVRSYQRKRISNQRRNQSQRSKSYRRKRRAARYNELLGRA